MKTIASQVIAGDPFMFNVFINTFFDKWYHLIDKLYVQMKTSSGSIIGKNPILKKFIYDVCRNDPKIVISEFDDDHTNLKYNNFDFDWYPKQYHSWTGFCMRYVVDISNEDIIFFTHDDCFIVDPKTLEYHINLVINNERDMVFDAGSLLPTKCSELALKQYPFIVDKLSEKLDINLFKNSVGLTTSYFIANRCDLLKTKLNFDGWWSLSGIKKPIGLEIPIQFENDELTLEYGHDVLFQMYKLGKTNPYIPAEECSHFITTLNGFKNDFDNLKKIKRSSGHVHLSAGSWSHSIHTSNIDEYIKSNWSLKNLNELDFFYYNRICFEEKNICMLLSFINQLDLKNYPYMTDFVNLTLQRINDLVFKINNILLSVNYNTNDFKNIDDHQILTNNILPYQIDIKKLPIDKFSQLYL